MLKLNVGVSRKVGLPDYSSAGASCNLELEIDQQVLEHSPEEFQARVRSVYTAARQAVEEELARSLDPQSIRPSDPATNGQASPDVGPSPDHNQGQPESHRNSRPRSDRGRGNSWFGSSRSGRGRQPASAKQVKAIYAIARAGGADLEGLLRDDYGVGRPEDLSLVQASQLIDQLQAAAEA